MNKLLKSVLSLCMALALMFSLGTAAFAAEWDITAGDITVNAGDTQTVSQGGAAAVADSSPIITGGSAETPSGNTITINADAGKTANVTIKDVHIDTSSVAGGGAAISVTGSGNTNIELDGNNSVTSAEDHAGIEKNGSNTGTLTIKDANENKGSLTATGGAGAAGIGGGDKSEGSHIKITGGEVTANVNDGRYGGGAGIGGGSSGEGNDITISGGTVNATGGNGAAGIGGGFQGNGENITILGGEVNATGGASAGNNYSVGAGIGGGNDGDGTNISISGGTVTAIGGSVTGENVSNGAAGIGGGGKGGSASDVSITGGTVNASGGNGAAGIGGGAPRYSTRAPGECEKVTISGDANVTATAGGAYVVDGKTIVNAGVPIGSGGSTAKTGVAVTPDTTGLTGNIILNEAKGKDNGAVGTATSCGATAAVTDSDLVRYYVTEGDEQIWLIGSAEGLCFTLNSEDVIKVFIDGEEVDFKLNEDGEIEISAEVLQALEAGEHEIEFIFSDGSCKAVFSVK